MCERTLENEPHRMGVWVWEEFKRNYIYFICDTCFKKYKTEEIEEKITMMLATKPRFKASSKGLADWFSKNYGKSKSATHP
jgi:hypothetical protein